MRENRRRIWIFLLSLVVLRLMIGLHFFGEGLTKINSGSFTCAPFLAQARGPLASWFYGLLDDFDGRVRLCINDNGEIEPARTIAVWEDYVLRVAANENFDSGQRQQANDALSRSTKYLTGFLEANRYEILAWLDSEERLAGFQRDGSNRSTAARQVESLSEQIDTIRYDRTRQAAPWFREIEAMWDDLESRINEIAGTASEADRLVLSRPYDPPWSSQDVIDRFLPFFDTTVGVLLVLGLLTRFAAVAGVGLLVGVVATQPFWVLGAENTWYQWIEIAGLFVLFASSAGTIAGLDYFLERRKSTEISEA
jgi:uncharacterized membrane protein YphA (DoxX/SURF4 family)